VNRIIVVNCFVHALADVDIGFLEVALLVLEKLGVLRHFIDDLLTFIIQSLSPFMLLLYGLIHLRQLIVLLLQLVLLSHELGVLLLYLYFLTDGLLEHGVHLQGNFLRKAPLLLPYFLLERFNFILELLRGSLPEVSL